MDDGRILVETSGAALRAALSSLLRVVGISLLKNIVRTAARGWTVIAMSLIDADRLSKAIYENVSAVCKCQNE